MKIASIISALSPISKYFCQRVITHSSHDDAEEYLYEVVRKNYPETFKCIGKIETFIHKNYQYDMTHSEQLYLTLHLERLMKTKRDEKSTQ